MVAASISASRAAVSYIRIMKNWSRSPVRLAGSGWARSALMACWLLWATGLAVGAFISGMPARSARWMASVGSAVAAYLKKDRMQARRWL